MRPGGIFKRTAQVPLAARQLKVSKADLLEVAWDLAALSHDQGCDDNAATLKALVEAINACREVRGAKPLKP